MPESCDTAEDAHWPVLEGKVGWRNVGRGGRLWNPREEATSREDSAHQILGLILHHKVLQIGLLL
jgi:hypothetical protein